MKLPDHIIVEPKSAFEKGRRIKPTAAEREQLLVDCVVTALRWLDVQAPGRAYGALSEGLREYRESKS